MPDVGDILVEKYRLVRLLGEGGMGAVYEAEHIRIGKRLAVKFLLPQFIENEEVVTRFTREAEAAAAIGHRSIIDIHDIGTSKDGSLFLVMEYLDGQSLGQCLGSGGALPVQTASYVVAQVLSALDAAHDKEIVHRDLKPDNIYLVESGQVLPDIKLLDFGISKMAPLGGSPEDRLTRTGAIMGTPYYMAPEQARGKKDLNHLVDIYAMGVILYEALTGRTPFQGDNTFALVYDILNAPLTPPRHVRSDIPDGLEYIIVKAMARDETQRFQTSAEMLHALLAYVEPHAVGRIAMPKKGPRANQPPSIATPSGISLATGPGSVPATQALPSGMQSAPGTNMAWQTGVNTATEEQGGSRKGLYIGLGVVGMIVLLAAVGGTLYFLGPFSSPPAETVTAAAPPAPPPPTKVEPAELPPEPEKAPEDPAPPTKAEVELTLAGLPAGAQVFLDDTQVEGNVITVEPSDNTREIRVEAEGFEPWSRTMSVRSSETITAEMTRAQVAKTTGRGGGRRPPTKGTDPAPPEPPTKAPDSPFATTFDRQPATPFGARFE